MSCTNRGRKLWYGVLLLIAVLPLIPGPLQSPFAQHVLVLTLLFACMSQAWNILGGYCGQVSFGHSVFFGIGAYGAGMAVVTYGFTPWPGAIIGALLAAIVSLIISYPCFRRDVAFRVLLQGYSSRWKSCTEHDRRSAASVQRNFGYHGRLAGT